MGEEDCDSLDGNCYCDNVCYEYGDCCVDIAALTCPGNEVHCNFAIMVSLMTLLLYVSDQGVQ